MADSDYALWYFIEGYNFISRVIIPKNKFATDLIKEIHGQSSFRYHKGIRANQLVLLKVEIDLLQHLGNICELRAPDNATKISPMKQIKQLWPDKPNQHYVYICVRLPAPEAKEDDSTEEEDLNGPSGLSNEGTF